MITIRDVARHAGVSVATISRVLNNSPLVSPETRELVMKAVSELGYRPNANAQALATQVSDTIGVVVMDVSDAFLVRWLKRWIPWPSSSRKTSSLVTATTKRKKSVTPLRC
jgi:transcriptional regulator, LacI family